MKYWRGYLVAAIIGFFTWALSAYAKTHTKLIDMVYPYFARMVQSTLSSWTSSVDVVLWQLLALLAIAALLVGIVMMIIWKWNPIQFIGWVLAAASLVFFLHTGVYGLNYYAGPMAEDIRLEVTEYNAAQLEEAAAYYRDHANTLSGQIRRTAEGKPDFPDFDTLAQQAGNGFHNLTYQRGYSIFAGDLTPVKKLAWADFMTSTGTTGMHMPITGEAAVNPKIPAVAMPFTMCHEMAHRMSIAQEQDANFAAFMACDANESVEFRYSGYFMAYVYCYNALAQADAAAAARVRSGADARLLQDIMDYNRYFSEKEDKEASKTVDKLNDAYINASGNDRGIESYGDVVQLLVSWHIQEVVLPAQAEQEQSKFDPYAIMPGQQTDGGQSNG